MKFSIGIDIGGSHISGGLVNSETGSLILNTYFEESINPLWAKAEILDTWTRFIQRLLTKNKHQGIQKIGFAMPGPFDYKKGIASFEGVPKYNSLKGVNVGNHLRSKLIGGENLKINFMNDATAFALGEYRAGAAQNINRVWVLTLGTGFGSTFLSGGSPLLSGLGMPEGGYLWNQKFKNGIADEYFSTRWFVHTWKKRAGQEILNVKALAEKVDKGDKDAEKIFSSFAENLARFLIPWIKSTQTEGIIIGGGISKAWNYFEPPLAETLKNECPEIIIRPGTLGKYAPIIGAVL